MIRDALLVARARARARLKTAALAVRDICEIAPSSLKHAAEDMYELREELSNATRYIADMSEALKSMRKQVSDFLHFEALRGDDYRAMRAGIDAHGEMLRVMVERQGRLDRVDRLEHALGAIAAKDYGDPGEGYQHRTPQDWARWALEHE